MMYGQLTDLVLYHLKERGPRMRFQIEDDLGLPRRSLGDTLTRLVKVCALGPSTGQRRARIIGWSREVPGEKREAMPRPLYAFGHGTNAPRPQRMSNTETCRRWRNKVKQESVHVSEMQG